MSKRIGRKGASYGQLNVRAGMTVNAGPFIGVIKNNLDPTRAGRLQVYIAELGGADVDDPSNWYTVSYASPFRGMTVPLGKWGLRSADETRNDVENGMQSYGMWFTPPDLGVKVLCVFANGDPSQGYYIGSIVESFDSYMTPGLSANDSAFYEWDPAKYTAQQEAQKYVELPAKDGTSEIPYRLPVSEASTSRQDDNDDVQFSDLKRLPHIFQTVRLGKQGLAFDATRGTTSSSSVRENPSRVFGISTPGRTYPFKDKATSLQTMEEINKADINNLDPALIEKMTMPYRVGGHTITMDDGSVQGEDAGIRIRTSSGNMILLDDTNEQIYIVNAGGTAWIEMSPSGRIEFFSESAFSVRSKGDINFHSDKNINLHAAGGAINMYAATKIRGESQGQISLRSQTQINLWSDKQLTVGSLGNLILSAAGTASMKAGDRIIEQAGKILLNTEGAPDAKAPEVIPQVDHIETGKIGEVWWTTNKFKSIATIAPAHEPWPSHEINGIKTRQVPGTAQPAPIKQTPETNSVANVGDVAAQKNPSGPVCGLTPAETKALLAELGKRESGGKKTGALGPAVLNQPITTQYNTYNVYGYVGKYQFGAEALETCGYIKAGTFKRYSGSTGTKGAGNRNWAILTDRSNWTGKGTINSLDDWMANGAEQENCAEYWMGTVLCKQLNKLGVIDSTTPANEVAGYLMVAHLNGPGKAKSYKNGDRSTSGPNASVQTYFEAGKASIANASKINGNIG